MLFRSAISKVSHYDNVVTDLVAQLPQPQSFLLRGVDKTFPSETWERWEIARAKLEYYHVVLSGGKLMMSIGGSCLLLALITIRRKRLRHATAHRATNGNVAQRQAPAA